MGALIFDGDTVLLVERGREPLKGQWSLPGGVVEAGERLEEAIIREVFEETGLVVEATEIATVFQRIMPDAEGKLEYHYVLVDYYCRVTGGELKAGDDSSRVAWFMPDQLKTIPLTEGTLTVIRATHKPVGSWTLTNR